MHVYYFLLWDWTFYLICCSDSGLCYILLKITAFYSIFQLTCVNSNYNLSSYNVAADFLIYSYDFPVLASSIASFCVCIICQSAKSLGIHRACLLSFFLVSRDLTVSCTALYRLCPVHCRCIRLHFLQHSCCMVEECVS